MSFQQRIDYTPKAPDRTGWKERHLAAVNKWRSSRHLNLDTALALLAHAGRCYAHAHRKRFSSSIRDDCVLGEPHAAIEAELRALSGNYLDTSRRWYPTAYSHHDAALVRYFQGWLGLADALTDLTVSDPDLAASGFRSWVLIGSRLRELLNGPSGRLDCGTLDSLLCQASERVADFFGEDNAITKLIRQEELI